MTISEKQAQTFRFFKENEGRKFTAIDINLAVRTSDARLMSIAVSVVPDIAYLTK